MPLCSGLLTWVIWRKQPPTIAQMRSTHGIDGGDQINQCRRNIKLARKSKGASSSLYIILSSRLKYWVFSSKVWAHALLSAKLRTHPHTDCVLQKGYALFTMDLDFNKVKHRGFSCDEGWHGLDCDTASFEGIAELDQVCAFLVWKRVKQ